MKISLMRINGVLVQPSKLVMMFSTEGFTGPFRKL